jgi:hypothetical protein
MDARVKDKSERLDCSEDVQESGYLTEDALSACRSLQLGSVSLYSMLMSMMREYI